MSIPPPSASTCPLPKPAALPGLSLLSAVLWLGTCAGACRPPLPDPPARPADAGAGAEGGEPPVVIEPAVDGGAAPPVARFHVAAGGDAAAAPPMLFEGELGSYYIGRIEKGDLPSTLEERRVPSLSWDEPGATVLAPVVPLSADTLYSIASATRGSIGTVQVVDDGAPYLARLWPPPAAAGAPLAVYCGNAGDAPGAGLDVVLEPGAVAARLEPGVAASGLGAGRCVTLRAGADAGAGPLVPPPRVGDMALDPAPFGPAAVEPAPPTSCAPDEIAFGPGCAVVEDDRVVVRSTSDARLWCVESAGVAFVESVTAGKRFVVRGFAPFRSARVDVTVLDLAGGEARDAFQITTRQVQAHVVLNEVLANPAGAEPAQEWVELVNDGSGAIDIADWVLADSAGESVLPSATLEPGAYALVVRDGFARDDGVDTPVPPDVALIVVPQIGKNGLSNAGEPLELRDAEGNVVSRFPALSASKGGVSMARRDPWSLDDDATAFGRHAGDGASPGAPNVLAP